MELVLTIIAGLGLLIFVLSYLSYLFKGFKHHFVTGLIATLPILNIVTLPALWYKAGKTFFLGIFGLLIFAASWFFGAEQGLKNLVGSLSSNSETVVASRPNTINTAIPLSLPRSNSQTNILKGNSNTIHPTSKKSESLEDRPFIDESKLQGLPNTALYKLSFDVIPVESITTLFNRIVKISLTNGQIIEGRIINVNSNTVLLKSGLSEQEYPTSNIVKLRLMVKK